MSDAEQIGFDIDFDEKTQTWLDWTAPARIQAQVRTFLEETLSLPDLPAEPLDWWAAPLRSRIEEAARAVFPDPDALTAPENRDIADQFVCFLGDMFIRRTGMEWTNIPEWGAPLYSDIGPCVRFAGDPVSAVSMVRMAQSAASGEAGERFGFVWGTLDDCVRRKTNSDT